MDGVPACFEEPGGDLDRGPEEGYVLDFEEQVVEARDVLNSAAEFSEAGGVVEVAGFGVGAAGAEEGCYGGEDFVKEVGREVANEIVLELGVELEVGFCCVDFDEGSVEELVLSLVVGFFSAGVVT